MSYLPHWPVPASFGNAKIDSELVFDRMNKVLSKLGNPHKKLSPSIHISGTNGKGSAAAFLSQILQKNGYLVNLYTSPHIHNCNERIVIEGLQISDSHLYDITEKVRIASGELPLTFFEAFTIMAIVAFYESKSDFNIFEAGMGARIDATNIVENRVASIITPISFDHEEYLGDNISKIAFEKAHILRPDIPLILGPQPKDALKVIKLIAGDQKAKIINYDENFSIEINEDDSFDFQSGFAKISSIPSPSLIGQHQYINASVAIATALNLKNIKLSHDAIKDAVKSVKWPNRIEKISGGLNKFISDESEIYIDSAHNLAGAYALANWLNEDLCKKNIVIAGFSLGKCKESFLKILNGPSNEIIAVRVDGEPNPEETSKIKEVGEKVGVNITEKEDLLEVFHYLSKEYDGEKIRVIICGSIHLARDVRKYLSFTAD